MKLLPILLTAFIAFPTLAAAEKPGDAIIAKLEKIKLPKISMEDTTAEEALDFLRQRTVELDPDADQARKGVSFIVRRQSKPPVIPEQNEQAEARIKFVANDISILAALKEIGKQAKIDIYLTSIGIVISPAGTPPFPNAKGREGEIWHTIFKTPIKAPE